MWLVIMNTGMRELFEQLERLKIEERKPETENGKQKKSNLIIHI